MGPGVGRKHSRKDRVGKKCEEEFGKRSWNRFGHPRAILFEAWGVLGDHFGHPGAHIWHPGGPFGHPGGSLLAPWGSLWAPRESFLNLGGRQNGFCQ